MNPAEGMDVCLMCWLCCIGDSLFDGLITCAEESCVCVCVCVCDLGTSTVRWPKPYLECCVTVKNKLKVLLAVFVTFTRSLMVTWCLNFNQE